MDSKLRFSEHHQKKQPQSKISQLKSPTPAKLNWYSNLSIKDSPKVRLFMVWGILVAGTLGLAWNLHRLQIVEAPKLEEKARQQQMVYLRPYVPRRSIIERQNNVIATDRLVYSLYVHPKLFKEDATKIAKKLAPILQTHTSETLVKKFKQQESGIRLNAALSEDIANQIQRLSLDGLELIRHYSRYYPQQDLVADVLGYVDLDHKGQAGIELSQETLLERSVLTLQLSRAGNGAIMPAHLPEGLLNFDELQLQLTIDLPLQRAARFALKQAKAKYNAKRGAVIVMDVRDGSILALVCDPSYDPNRYYDADLELFKNWTVMDLYEPGSTFKPINVAIALDAGVIKANSVFYDPGQIRIDRWSIANHDFRSKGGHGNIDVRKILEVSSNVGMVKIMQRLDSKAYYQALKKLGLGDKIGLDLPGDAPSYLKDKGQFTSSAIEPATAAFGQGLSLTPLKLVQLHAALANGGKLVTPHVVKGLVDSQGHYHWQPTLKTTPVFKAQTTKIVTEMMESVVTDGSGQNAATPGYRIAGKTGTAQKASPNGGYLRNAKITSFIATLPVESPRYVLLAVIDEPKGENTFGSTVAAPIVKSVIDALIAIEQLPPSQPIKPQKPTN